MRFFITVLSSMILLSGCALYSGWKDKPTPAPEDSKNSTTVTTPDQTKNNPANAAQQKAATSAAKMMSPITH